MKEIFKNKRIVILGDSICEHGYYTYDMRSFIKRSEDKCYVFNRGIGGTRADMAFDLLDDEVFALRPDYCFICFGGNDLGAWLYSSKLTVDEKVLEERRIRNENYYNGIKYIVSHCKEKGVIPVLLSSYSSNEKIIESNDIKTLADNKEKAVNMDSSFYKQETIKNLNNAKKPYRDFIKKIAEEDDGVLFLDMLEETHKYMLTESEMFAKDGVHYSVKGHGFIAKILLEFLGYENVPSEFIKDDENDSLEKIVQLERSIRFVRYNPHNKVFGDFTKEQIIENCKKVFSDPNEENWSKRYHQNYLDHSEKVDEIRDQIDSLTVKYIGE